jgi:hypothetical protein
MFSHNNNSTFLYLSLLHSCDQIPDRNNLREGIFILSMITVHHGNKDITEQKNSHHGIQEAE